ncbi:MAG TPA: PKD domain-containing protein [Bryobacteraceae bacterium]|nr:PKD domain-containing protein [Bryobacteraceae bacterium]
MGVHTRRPGPYRALASSTSLEGGLSGVLTSVVRISNKDSSAVERADAHGSRVRLKRGVQAAPTAVAGPKDLTTLAIQIQLDGSKATRTDGEPLTYRWSVAPGSPVPAISGANTATPTVQFPTGPVAYIFELTVTDPAGRTATDNVTVNLLEPRSDPRHARC